MSTRVSILIFSAFLLVVAGCKHSVVENNDGGKGAKAAPVKSEDAELENAETENAKSVDLFDGTTLTNWKSTNFGGEGDVTVVDGTIQLETGYSMTGITWAGDDLPKTDYELSLDAKRVDGNDFFCGLTVPVAGSHCSLIVGGWGGALLGLSCIDGFDASENRTTQFHDFESDRWYQFKIRVKPDSITVWMDGKEIVHHPLEGHKITVRNETLPSCPLGVCSFETTAQLKNFKLKTSTSPSETSK